MIPVRNAIGGLGNLLFKEAYIYAQMMDGVIPDIYLQDEKYFFKYKSQIQYRFGQDIGFQPYVAVHVRRGDYVGSDFHVDLTETDYYERAMALFPNNKFLVFSDSPIWCKEKFKDNSRVKVIEGGNEVNEVEDLNMMASCQAIIMANSSFSWWAAYLNPNPSKRIVAPYEGRWFKDGIIRTVLPIEYEQI